MPAELNAVRISIACRDARGSRRQPSAITPITYVPVMARPLRCPRITLDLGGTCVAVPGMGHCEPSVRRVESERFEALEARFDPGTR